MRAQFQLTVFYREELLFATFFTVSGEVMKQTNNCRYSVSGCMCLCVCVCVTLVYAE